MTDALIPHVVSAQEAAHALGITVSDLAGNLTSATQARLAAIGKRIETSEIESLDQFDEEIAEVRRLVESTLVCWQVVTAELDEETNDL